MAKETELKLSLPASAIARFRKHPCLEDLVPSRQRLENIYYETPEFDLERRRVALRHRRTRWGWLLTVKSAEPAAGALAQRNEWEAPSQPGVFDFSHVDDAKLRRDLEAQVPRLFPVFTTDFLRTTWILETGTGARIELALDRGEIRCGDRKAPICEIELELLEGDVSALFDVALALQSSVPLRPSAASKAERGLALFSGVPVVPVRVGRSPLGKGMLPTEAFKAVIFDCLDQIQRNEAGALTGTDPEYLHQIRVAIRRLRAAMRFWKPLLPPGFHLEFSGPWQATARTLGEARNRDVLATQILPPLIASFPAHRQLVAMASRAGKARAVAMRSVRGALATEAFARLMLRFSAAVHALPESVPESSLRHFAGRRLQRFHRETEELAAALSGEVRADHRLRIAIKRLRYALEFFGPLYSRKRGRRFLNNMAEIQELLGAMNDIAMARDLLAEPAVASRRFRQGDIVTAWLDGRLALLRQLLPSALKAFRSAERPWR